MMKDNDGKKHDGQAKFIDCEIDCVFPVFDICIQKGQNITCSGNLLSIIT